MDLEKQPGDWNAEVIQENWGLDGIIGLLILNLCLLSPHMVWGRSNRFRPCLHSSSSYLEELCQIGATEEYRKEHLAKIIHKNVHDPGKSYSLPTLQYFFITHEMTKVNKEGNPAWKQIKGSQSISNLRGETLEGDMKVLSFCLSGDRGGSRSMVVVHLSLKSF